MAVHALFMPMMDLKASQLPFFSFSARMPFLTDQVLNELLS
jgi:hypothetical protein